MSTDSDSSVPTPVGVYNDRPDAAIRDLR